MPDAAAYTEHQWGAHFHRDDRHAGDLRAIRDGRTHLLDRNWICLGPSWVDFLGLLPQTHRQGLDVRRWRDRPLFAGADDRTVDVVLASIAVKVLGGQDEELPCLLTTVWAHELLHAYDAVRLLADRRGWHPTR